MANIILNNYCNQKCSYCFAWKNMEDNSLQQEMSLSTFLYCLKHLRTIGDDRVRILGGEPMLYSKIREVFLLSIKGGFKMTIFSNFKIPLSKWREVLDLGENYDYSRLHFNLNLNDKDFYKKGEQDMIYDSLDFLTQKGCDVVISYNVYEYSYAYDFIFETAKCYDITSVILKITNTVIGDEEIIDTNSQEYGSYIYMIVKKYYKDFHIAFGCGLSSKSFTYEQKSFLEKQAGITLRYTCGNNGGKYDINTDGTVYKCFPLQSLYEKTPIFIYSPLFQKNTFLGVKTFIEGVVPKDKNLKYDEKCLGNQMVEN